MGYACPVCETPHPDGEHLANHLAFTALLGREDHEAWLDEHAPDWDQQGPEELAPLVVEAVPETEFPQVFDDTTPSEGAHEHGQGHDHEHGHAGEDAAPSVEEHLARGGRRGYGRGDLTADAEEALAEAREMTEAMLEDDLADGDGDGEADEDDPDVEDADDA
jgi:hypothetical protein